MKLFASILLLSLSTLCSRSYGQCECLSPSVPEDTLYTFYISANPAWCEVSGYLDQNGFTVEYSTESTGFYETFSIPEGFFCDPVSHSQSIYINGQLNQEQTNAEYPLAFFAQLGNTYEFRWTYESPLGDDNAGCNTITQSIFLAAVDTIPPQWSEPLPEATFFMDDANWDGTGLASALSTFLNDNCGVEEVYIENINWEAFCTALDSDLPFSVDLVAVDYSGNSSASSASFYFYSLIDMNACMEMLPADLNQDYIVNTADMIYFLSIFGCVSDEFTECVADFNDDGSTNSADLLVMLTYFGTDY